MNTLKNLIIILSLFLGGVTITSCSDEDEYAAAAAAASDNNFPVSQPVIAPKDSTTQKQENTPTQKQMQDSILNSISKLDTQVSGLLTEEKEVKDTIDQTQQEIKELKDSSNLKILIAWVIAVISLLTAIIALMSNNTLTKRVNRLRNDYNNLDQQVKLLNNQIAAAANSSRSRSSYAPANSNEYNNLSARISQLERQLNNPNLKNSTQQKQVVNNPNQASAPATPVRTGYFELPTKKSETEGYFRRLLDTRDSDSRFSVEVRDNIADFKLLEGSLYFNDLRSSDAIKMAIELEGCAPSEATRMTTKRPGVAKKDGDRWDITQKAIIVLYQ